MEKLDSYRKYLAYTKKEFLKVKLELGTQTDTVRLASLFRHDLESSATEDMHCSFRVISTPVGTNLVFFRNSFYS